MLGIKVLKNEKKWAPGYFYALNLRSHAIKLLDTADEDHRKHEHDMRALKRMGIETLWQGTKTGRKVLYVYDSASIDFDEWDWWKSRGGIYFVSRMKDGTAYECLDELEIDHENGLNHGITSDKKIIVNNQSILRRIVCVDPQTGKVRCNGFLDQQVSIFLRACLKSQPNPMYKRADAVEFLA